MKIVICCSMSQVSHAKEAVRKFLLNDTKMDTHNVEVEFPEPCKPGHYMSAHRKFWLTKMDKADLVLILTKFDGTMGVSTGYEMAYCMHQNIPFLIIGNELPYMPNEDKRRQG